MSSLITQGLFELTGATPDDNPAPSPSSLLFHLTPDILALGRQAFDTLIFELGKNCLCYSESASPTVCPNCIFNSQTGRSTGIYNGVGSQPFSGGLCPVCHGTGFLPGNEQITTSVLLLIDWEPKVYGLESDVLKKPNNIISTKGFLVDLPTVKQSKYMVIDNANAVYQGNRYVLFGEPAIPGNIIKNRYFECFWKRSGS